MFSFVHKMSINEHGVSSYYTIYTIEFFWGFTPKFVLRLIISGIFYVER